MSLRSMTEIAFEILSDQEKERSFNELWQIVSAELQFSEEQKVNKIAPFYSALTLDTRFIALKDNMWDLRKRHTYNEAHIDISTIVLDDDIDKYELEIDLIDDISELLESEDKF